MYNQSTNLLYETIVPCAIDNGELCTYGTCMPAIRHDSTYSRIRLLYSLIQDANPLLDTVISLVPFHLYCYSIIFSSALGSQMTCRVGRWCRSHATQPCILGKRWTPLLHLETPETWLVIFLGAVPRMPMQPDLSPSRSHSNRAGKISSVQLLLCLRQSPALEPTQLCILWTI